MNPTEYNYNHNYLCRFNDIIITHILNKEPAIYWGNFQPGDWEKLKEYASANGTDVSQEGFEFLNIKHYSLEERK